MTCWRIRNILGVVHEQIRDYRSPVCHPSFGWDSLISNGYCKTRTTQVALGNSSAFTAGYSGWCMYVMQGIRVPRQTRYVVDPEILVQHVAHRFLGLRAVSLQAVVCVTVVQTR